MRGRSSAWYRTRVNLQHVPAKLRPAQEALDPDEQNLTGWEGMSEEDWEKWKERGEGGGTKANK